MDTEGKKRLQNLMEERTVRTDGADQESGLVAGFVLTEFRNQN
jgi:hypothetical protein